MIARLLAIENLVVVISFLVAFLVAVFGRLVVHLQPVFNFLDVQVADAGRFIAFRGMLECFIALSAMLV